MYQKIRKCLEQKREIKKKSNLPIYVSATIKESMKHKREIIFFRNIPNGCAQMKTAKTFNTIYTIYDLSKLITRKFHSTRYTVRQEWRLMSAFSSNFASLLRSIWRNRGEKRKNKKEKKVKYRQRTRGEKRRTERRGDEL